MICTRDIIRDGNAFDNRTASVRLDYNDVISWLERRGENFYSFQKEMLKDMCEGREFISFRGAGRGLIAGYLGEYIAHLFAENNYTKEPDKRYPLVLGLNSGLVSKKSVHNIKQALPEKAFKKEYSLDIDYGGEAKK